MRIIFYANIWVFKACPPPRVFGKTALLFCFFLSFKQLHFKNCCIIVCLHFKPDSRIILSEKGPKRDEHCNSMIIQPHNSQRNTALLLSDIIGDADEHLNVSTTISI